ncbi:MAG: CRTAC1 family protein [Bacteroidota bacterium]
MKTILPPLLFLLPLVLAAQTFTPLTDDPIANDSTALGCAWGDMDDDGFPDLITSTPQLYRNNGDGTFSVSFQSDFNAGGGISGTIGDYNNDTKPDFYTASLSTAGKLFRNDGTGNLERVLSEPFNSDSSDFQSASWVDLENDGRLDLYVTAGGNVGFRDNYLYRNNMDGTFSRDSTSLIAQDSSGTTHCAWGDFDNDGFADLYLANNFPSTDSLANYCYQNNGDGTFRRITDGPIVTDQFSSFGASWGDYDNDGDLDLFVTNVGTDQLYQNNGDGTFTAIRNRPINGDTRLSIGSAWADYDNDGDLDLIVSRLGTGNSLFDNQGDGTFVEVIGEPFTLHEGFGCTWADWDRDGDLDLFFARADGGRHRPYTNRGNNNNWISIRALGTLSNTMGIGARIELVATINGQSVRQIREISGQTGALGQSEPRAHFGLGDATSLDTLLIRWPTGAVQQEIDVAINQHLTIVEDFGSAVTENPPSSAVTRFAIFPNPVDAAATLQFDLQRPAQIAIQFTDATGRTVHILGASTYAAGQHRVAWPGEALASGWYHCRLVVDGQTILLRRVVVP